MGIQKNGLLFKIARQRITVSRIFAVLVLLLILFTASSFSQDSLTDTLLEMSGLFLLTICSIGRLWALLYISGYKKLELITEGPYSIVRHPLYVFSLIGAIGIGLASENILVLAVLIIFYLLYYPLTIIVEEKKLVDKFDQGYLDYIKRTPRFIPKFSLYKGSVQYQINTDVFVRKLVFGMWFIWIFIILHIIEMLQQSGHIPVILKVP
ncbi:MAG: isoprenylcysteine carboxylmethyltransferase family protein [Phycisphaerae bacterium]|nr:isoprenylcysteine carboxylmethyltransferase family protein [Phycisphaerae bacterium]MDD5381576.1 isoprenylcysteine carboxylmethyltransferase family protein [Phycisphaerae bacterium]